VIVMSHRYIVTNSAGTAITAPTLATVGTPGIAMPLFGNTTAAANATVGSRCLFMGAQSLCLADLGTPYWDESDTNDYGNQPGLSVGKLYGLAKPQYLKSYDDAGNLQDFGVMTLDVAHT